MNRRESPEIRFFEGFEWAVPIAFAAALSAHRFEEGDVLFRDAADYSPESPSISDRPEAARAADRRRGGAGKSKRLPRTRAIQVLHPPRSARSTPGAAGGDGDRKQASWESEVEIELVDLAAGTRESRRITQGKLLMTLWQGGEDWLDPASEEPPMPRASRELAQELANALPAVRGVQSTAKGCRFVFVLDRASDASRVKAKAIADALASIGPVECVDLSPAEAQLADAETYHPALAIRALAVKGGGLEAAEAALKERLYVGQSAQSVTEEDSEETTKADRFSVARHGVLEAI